MVIKLSTANFQCLLTKITLFRELNYSVNIYNKIPWINVGVTDKHTEVDKIIELPMAFIACNHLFNIYLLSALQFFFVISSHRQPI